jgi:hypothetical protein
MDGPPIRTLALPCPKCQRVTLHYLYPKKLVCALCHQERHRPSSRRNGDGPTQALHSPSDSS